MTSKRHFTIPVVAGALGVGGAAMIAQAAEPTAAELQAQIQSLQAKVQQMETQRPATAITANPQPATVDSVLSDANRRSQLMEVEGMTAGHTEGEDGHFVLQSADGNFRLMPMLQLQFRNVTNWSENATASGKDTLENGFEINRAKLELFGNAFSPDLTYDIRWASGENNGGASLVLENAYVQWRFADDWSVRGGQFKDNVFHEETVSSRRQLAVDRSLVNEVIGGGRTDYVQGVALIWDNGGALRAEAAYHDGANSDNTSFQDVPTILPASNTNFGVSARVEYALQGNFRQYDDFTARNNKDDMLVLGAGLDLTQAGSDNVFFHTFDAQWEPQAVKGLGVYAAYLGAYADFNNGAGAGNDTSYDWGFLVQAGYMVNEKCEVFARYSLTNLDSDVPGFSLKTDKFNELTFGANYYMHGHSAKFTIDASILPDGSPANISSADYLANDGDTEIVVRAQFQLLI
jgi:hypothetical protein